MWTGDSNLSIRESLRAALDVHTPPPNSMARGRRASAMHQAQFPPQGQGQGHGQGQGQGQGQGISRGSAAAAVVSSAGQGRRVGGPGGPSSSSSGAARRQTALPRLPSYVQANTQAQAGTHTSAHTNTHTSTHTNTSTRRAATAPTAVSAAGREHSREGHGRPGPLDETNVTDRSRSGSNASSSSSNSSAATKAERTQPLSALRSRVRSGSRESR
jgi:hypothetical protein